MHRTNVHRPVIGIAGTAVLALLYHRLGDNRVHDQFSAGLIAVTFGFATLVILHYTVDWMWRAVGVLVAIAGISLTYFLIWGRGGDYINFNQLVTRSILRAALDVGGVLTMLGLITYVVDRHRGRPVRLLGLLGGEDD